MKGKISLIGAGLGDPELLTVKALRKIQEADAVVYDRLINPAILNSCKADCEKIYVGKNPKFHPIPQNQIEEILIQKAKEGKVVVRLKSGDPYVFGRGGEEGAHLRSENIPIEIIPGVTSAIGGLAYGGIPITHRDYASSFHVYTGHLKQGKEALDIDWKTAAKAEGTLVFLMGMAELQRITEELLKQGKSPNCPAAVIQWASRKQQKTVVGTVETIYAKAMEAKLQPPSLIVIGEVVQLRPALNFFEERPLFGCSVALPYTEDRKMFTKLTDLGAEVIELPKPVIQVLASETDINQYQRFIFFDKLSVDIFLQRIREQKLDWRKFNGKSVIAVGKQVQKSLLDIGIFTDASYSSLQQFWETHRDWREDIESQRALFVGDNFTKGTLSGISENPLLLQNFLMTHQISLQRADEAWQEADFLYFPSSKSARIFLECLSEEELKLLSKKQVIVMGEATKDRFAIYQIPVIQSAEATYASVVELLIEASFTG